MLTTVCGEKVAIIITQGFSKVSLETLPDDSYTDDGDSHGGLSYVA